jgi:hypothetical protein
MKIDCFCIAQKKKEKNGKKKKECSYKKGHPPDLNGNNGIFCAHDLTREGGRAMD